MSTSKTEHLNLHAWAKNDQVLMEEFNENFQKLDQEVGGCARAYTGTYTGTGTYGSGNLNSITFPFEPKFVFITSQNGELYQAMIAIRGMTGAYVYQSVLNSDYYYRAAITWSGNTMKWYSTQSAYYQLNYSNLKYFYFAIG